MPPASLAQTIAAKYNLDATYVAETLEKADAKGDGKPCCTQSILGYILNSKLSVAVWHSENCPPSKWVLNGRLIFERRSLSPCLGKYWELKWSPFDLSVLEEVLGTNRATGFSVERSPF